VVAGTPLVVLVRLKDVPSPDREKVMSAKLTPASEQEHVSDPLTLQRLVSVSVT